MPTTTSIGDVITNGLETYVILEEIGRGETSTFYRVVCKSGRLRNRQLALKKIFSPTSPPLRIDNTPLHQALHHPNIVSLFSVFSLPLGTIHILELCAVGNMSDLLRSRPSSTLLEPELRGVIKSLVDALVYLKKELVLHRNINLSSILWTGDYRVKLSSFEFSVRLPTEDSETSSLCGLPNFAAPEMISGLSYGFAVDIWSVGCVMLACLSGLLPFDANTVPEICRNVLNGAYTLPEHLSAEGKALITEIVQIKPDKRLSLPRILSHPFLLKQTPIVSLRPTNTDINPNTTQKDTPLHPRKKPHQLSNFPSGYTNQIERRTVRHSSDHSLQGSRNKTRSVLGNIANLNLRNILRDEITSEKAVYSSGPTRRTVSNPTPRSASSPPRFRTFNTYSETSTRHAVLLNDPSPPSLIVDDSNEDIAVSNSVMNALSVEVDTKSSEVTRVLQEDLLPKDYRELKPDVSQLKKKLGPRDKLEDSLMKTPSNLVKIPIGTGRPTPFNTSSMSCQTHKTTFGQITILPSHSLLVDFREGQRRRGLKGDEVFVVDTNGSKISIYSAPHLSSPCCLIEPTEIFSIQTLPSIYWKQYNDAGRLVDQIKRRTPKLILYTTIAKCVLMANAPRGDIELLFGAFSPPSSKIMQPESNPSMRLRFSRQDQTLEFARHISDARGEEWTKKVIPSVIESPYISTGDWRKLERVEKDAIPHLSHFVRVCEIVEGLMDQWPSVISSTDLSDNDNNTIPPANSMSKKQSKSWNGCTSLPTIANSLSSFSLAPRPPRLSATTAQSTLDGDGTIQAITSDYPPQRNGCSMKATQFDGNPAWGNGDRTIGSHDIQTRFIPSVGWCIRHGSRVSQGGGYQIMFLDGVALDIDVDEDWAKFRSRSGEITTYKIQDCGSERKISERMKAFEEFVSLFDDSKD